MFNNVRPRVVNGGAQTNLYLFSFKPSSIDRTDNLFFFLLYRKMMKKLLCEKTRNTIRFIFRQGSTVLLPLKSFSYTFVRKKRKPCFTFTSSKELPTVETHCKRWKRILAQLIFCQGFEKNAQQLEGIAISFFMATVTEQVWSL